MKRPRIPKRVTSKFSMVVVIDHFDWDFGLGIGWRDNQAVDVHDHLHIVGSTQQKDRTLSVDLGLVPETTPVKEWRSGVEHLGRFNRVKGGFDGAATITAEALPSVLTMLCAGRYPAITLGLHKEGRVWYNIVDYRFEHEIPPEGAYDE